MSILKPNPPYDLFEEVNVGRREFIVHEDHSSETPFSRKMLIGFGGLILAVALFFGISYFASGSHEGGAGELPYFQELSGAMGQDPNTVAQRLYNTGAQVVCDSERGEYVLAESVNFVLQNFDVTLSYDAKEKLRSVTYDMQLSEDPESQAVYAYHLMRQAQDAWGFSEGTIFSSRFVEYEMEELKRLFTGSEPWQEEITWIVTKDISGLGFDKAEGDCISIRFYAVHPGNGELAQIRFVVGLDTAEKGDFAYTPGKFTGIHA